jgi:hypothetical protein
LSYVASSIHVLLDVSDGSPNFDVSYFLALKQFDLVCAQLLHRIYDFPSDLLHVIFVA